MDSLITMLSGISENKEDKSMKKLISIILTAVMIVTLAPSGAFACVSDSGDGAPYCIPVTIVRIRFPYFVRSSLI